MMIKDQLKEFIESSTDQVFLRREFAHFGGRSQVSKALKDLVDEGALTKIGLGIYAKTKVSVISGRIMPIRPVDVLAPDAMKKLGIEFGPSLLTWLYNTGQSTQIPAGTVFAIGKRRITRKIGFGGRFIQFEKSEIVKSNRK